MKSILTIFSFCLFFACAFSQKNGVQSDTDKVAKIYFYPNPATSFITFDIQKQPEKEYLIYIYNFLGRKVFTISSNSNKITIPLDNFFRGIYIFQIIDKANGSIVQSNKFQVNK